MAQSSSDDAADKDGLRSLARALAPHLRQLLNNPAEEPEFYDQKSSPLGRRKHLDLVRRGVLQGHKVGKRVLVCRDDVRAFIRQHGETSNADDSDVNDVLDDWDLERRSR